MQVGLDPIHTASGDDPCTGPRRAAEALLDRPLAAADVDRATQLVRELRACREFGLMSQLAEVVLRWRPDDLLMRSRYAQGLIEQGLLEAARDMLDRALGQVTAKDSTWSELVGLRGRALKQAFAEALDPSGRQAQKALLAALDSYRQGYEADRTRNWWHGVNLIALAMAARRPEVDARVPDDPVALAKEITATLTAQTGGGGDCYWCHASLAEAAIAESDWAAVETHIRNALDAPDAIAFAVAGTLRQFTQLYGLDRHTDPRAANIPAMLRAQLAHLPGGSVALSPAEVRAARQAGPEGGQLEALLGSEGPVIWRWWQEGLDAARSVAAVWDGRRRRFGTGFLVRGGDIFPPLGDEPCLLTNFHVVNRSGLGGGLRPDLAEVVFEAVDETIRYGVAEVAWESAIVRHDATLLRLTIRPTGAKPLPCGDQLPDLGSDFGRLGTALDPPRRLYVIGHPGGRDLQFSFQDNILLDHEDRAGGRRAVADVCRVHYRTPTEPGSSGSPVFAAEAWRVLALHHAGRKDGMPCLNGRPEGTYGANEGVSVASIRGAATTEASSSAVA
jgi:hypothetical protein